MVQVEFNIAEISTELNIKNYNIKFKIQFHLSTC